MDEAAVKAAELAMKGGRRFLLGLGYPKLLTGKAAGDLMHSSVSLSVSS
jgi:hypothetical protein